MALYVAGDYAGAAAGLRRVIAVDDSQVAAHFYLAVCVLQGNHNDEGLTLLQRVVASGESPYLEDAHFFLAKARIRQGDIAAARSELTRVIALDGDRRDEARQLLAQLQASPDQLRP
jgi:cytochrome c-type biogenesis protein CcmH/NrfG